MRILASHRHKDLLKASVPVPDTITLGFRPSTYGFGRGHIQPLTLSMNVLGLTLLFWWYHQIHAFKYHWYTETSKFIFPAQIFFLMPEPSPASLTYLIGCPINTSNLTCKNWIPFPKPILLGINSISVDGDFIFIVVRQNLQVMLILYSFEVMIGLILSHTFPSIQLCYLQNISIIWLLLAISTAMSWFK